MKLPRTGLLVAGIALVLSLVACASRPSAPTLDIEATVEARLGQERAIEATVETQPTATPYPTYTRAAVPTATTIPTATPPPIQTPTRAPGPTRVATATATPSLINVEGRQVKQYGLPPLMAIDPSANYTATIRTNQGSITVDLFASQAPKTVNSFVFLAREGFYNGIMFHRVIQGFMIQGGDPTGTGTAGPGYQFEDEIDRSLVRRAGHLGRGQPGGRYAHQRQPVLYYRRAHAPFEGKSHDFRLGCQRARRGNRNFLGAHRSRRPSH